MSAGSGRLPHAADAIGGPGSLTLDLTVLFALGTDDGAAMTLYAADVTCPTGISIDGAGSMDELDSDLLLGGGAELLGGGRDCGGEDFAALLLVGAGALLVLLGGGAALSSPAGLVGGGTLPEVSPPPNINEIGASSRSTSCAHVAAKHTRAATTYKCSRIRGNEVPK